MDFELYKSSICQKVKTLGYKAFIKDVLLSDEITKLVSSEEYAEAFYLLAMLDYLSNKHGVPLYNKYAPLRRLKLQTTLYPRDIELLTVLYKSDEYKQKAWEEAIPEFKRHNIIEREIEDVC